MRRKRDSSLIASLRRIAPWMDDPDPVREVVTTTEPGMQEDEVWEHFVIHSEHQQMTKEQQEEAISEVTNNGNSR